MNATAAKTIEILGDIGATPCCQAMPPRKQENPQHVVASPPQGVARDFAACDEVAGFAIGRSKSLRPRGPDTIRPAEPHPTLVVAIATPFGSDEIHRCSFDAHHPSLGGNASFGETQALGSSNLTFHPWSCRMMHMRQFLSRPCPNPGKTLGLRILYA